MTSLSHRGGPLPADFHPARRLLARTGLLLAVLAAAPPAQAVEAEIETRRAAQRTSFTDADILHGFFNAVFGAEFHLSGRVDRIRKFVGPVRVYVDSRAKPDRRAQVAAVVADIRSRVANLDIAMTTDRNSANLAVVLVRNRDLGKTIRDMFGREAGQRIEKALDPQCLSGFRKDEAYRIEHGIAILPVDAGEFIFRHCAYEEILQALGPINDDNTNPWTMFNDNVQLGFFGIYDQYLLNILYDPAIRPGMSKDEARAVMPKVLPRVRAFVAARNRLPDTAGGQRR